MHGLYRDFRKELQPVFDFIAERYNNDGDVVRALFARLKGHGRIDTQTDGLYSPVKCHRIHLPIITNGQVVFTIGGEEKGLGEGEIREVNNAKLHAVDNHNDADRIHLIIDWGPNSTVCPKDKRPPSAPASTPIKAAATAIPRYRPALPRPHCRPERAVLL